MSRRTLFTGAGIVPSMNGLPTEWQELSAGRRDVMLVLAVHQPMSGAEIQRALDPPHDHRAITNQHLAELEERGLVAREQSDEWNGTVANSLTDDGADLLTEAIDMFQLASVTLSR